MTHPLNISQLFYFIKSVNTCPIDRQVFKLILVKRGVEGVIQSKVRSVKFPPQFRLEQVFVLNSLSQNCPLSLHL